MRQSKPKELNLNASVEIDPSLILESTPKKFSANPEPTEQDVNRLDELDVTPKKGDLHLKGLADDDPAMVDDFMKDIEEINRLFLMPETLYWLHDKVNLSGKDDLLMQVFGKIRDLVNREKLRFPEQKTLFSNGGGQGARRGSPRKNGDTSKGRLDMGELNNVIP
jgi:hypothetical protein